MSKFSLGHTRAAKLTSTQVLEIRRLYSEENWSQSRLSRQFQVTSGTIGRIVRGESWQRYTQIPTDQEIEHRMVGSPGPSDEEIQASLARLTEKLAQPPAAPEVVENTYDLASLVEGLRKRKAELGVDDSPQTETGDSHEQIKRDD